MQSTSLTQVKEISRVLSPQPPSQVQSEGMHAELRTTLSESPFITNHSYIFLFVVSLCVYFFHILISVKLLINESRMFRPEISS